MWHGTCHVDGACNGFSRAQTQISPNIRISVITGLTSEEKRWLIVSTWKTCQNISEVARVVGVSRKVAQKWVQSFKAGNEVTPRSKSGRRPLLEHGGATRALHLLLDEGSCGAHGVALQLHHEGYTATTASNNTVIRAAKNLAREAGQVIQAVRGKPAKRLTVETKTKRVRFCKLNKRTCWSKVMFTDRKKFLFSFPGAKVKPVAWVFKGSTRQAAQVNHPLCVNLYAGITKCGVTCSHVVAGTSKHRSAFFNKQGKQSKNITSSEYQEVLQRTLLPEGQRLFTTRGDSTWVLQQDNDPSHRPAARVVQEWNTSHASSISVLGNWPPNSPDLNPIENVWSYVQARVNSRGCTTFEDFRAAVLEEVHGVPKTMLTRLFDSMPKRLAQVLSKGGDKINY